MLVHIGCQIFIQTNAYLAQLDQKKHNSLKFECFIMRNANKNFGCKMSALLPHYPLTVNELSKDN